MYIVNKEKMVWERVTWPSHILWTRTPYSGRVWQVTAPSGGDVGEGITAILAAYPDALAFETLEQALATFPPCPNRGEMAKLPVVRGRDGPLDWSYGSLVCPKCGAEYISAFGPFWKHP